MKIFELFESDNSNSIKPKTSSAKRAYKDYTNFKGAGSKKAELKKIMDREMKKFKNSDSEDHDSYPKDWPADKKYNAELKKNNKEKPKSKSTSAYHKLYGEDLDVFDIFGIFEDQITESNLDVALKNKAEKTGIKQSILRAVANRGMAAWRQHHRPGINQIQWALGRVNSFITGGKARDADKDLWDKRK